MGGYHNRRMDEVILIGDSIRMGYAPTVEAQLASARAESARAQAAAAEVNKSLRALRDELGAKAATGSSQGSSEGSSQGRTR